MNEQITLLKEANNARNEKHYQQAKHLYQRYLRDYGETADVAWMLAEVLYELSFRDTNEMVKLLNEAIHWIRKSISKDHNRPEFYVTLGKVLTAGAEVPNYEEAAICYRKALAINPSYVLAATGLAFLAQISESGVILSEAVEVMESLVQSQPDNQHVYMSLGYLYRKADRPTDAQAMYKRALLCSEPLAVNYSDTITTGIVQIGINKE